MVHTNQFEGSPVSKGEFQFDMWDVTPTDRWEWDVLKEEVKEHGVRNSLLLGANANSFNSTNPWKQRMFRTIYIKCVHETCIVR